MSKKEKMVLDLEKVREELLTMGLYTEANFLYDVIIMLEGR